MSQSSQRGSAIIMIFIAVVLFGALAYAFTQGSRTSTGWLQKEADKATATQSQQCDNAVNMAVKRLSLRGCGSNISYWGDGTNPNPGAPTDGSCSIFHVNGGGVTPCGNSVVSTDPCITGPLGAVCADGAIYVGIVGGNRIYARASDSSAASQWRTTAVDTPNTSSTTDGVANTDAMIVAGSALHPAAALCRSHGAAWYLPAREEAKIIYTNSGPLNLPGMGLKVLGTDYYWTSTQYAANAGTAVTFGGPVHFGSSKTSGNNVRCVRR